MRYSTFGSAGALALLLGGCASVHGGGGYGDCTGHGPGSPPPVAPVALAVVIEQHGSGPQLNLKPRTQEVWGACVDGQSGNFHTFHQFTNQVNMSVTFDPSLSGQAAWPSSANAAIGQSATPNGTYGDWQTGIPYYSTSGGQQALNFTIQVPTPPAANFYYHFNYIDHNGHVQQVEPAIQNH